MKPAIEVTMRIPGGWYGNDARYDEHYGIGHVTIDAKKTVQAIEWLKKRRFEILATQRSREKGGLLIEYQLRERRQGNRANYQDHDTSTSLSPVYDACG